MESSIVNKILSGASFQSTDFSYNFWDFLFLMRSCWLKWCSILLSEADESVVTNLPKLFRFFFLLPSTRSLSKASFVFLFLLYSRHKNNLTMKERKTHRGIVHLNENFFKRIFRFSLFTFVAHVTLFSNFIFRLKIQKLTLFIANEFVVFL